MTFRCIPRHQKEPSGKLACQEGFLFLGMPKLRHQYPALGMGMHRTLRSASQYT